MAVVRVLVLIALVGCGVSSSRRADDAAIDVAQLDDAAEPRDAPATEEPPRHVVGPCDAPPIFFEPYAPSRVLHVVPGAIGGDGSLAAPFGTIEQAAAVATPGTFILLAPGVHAPDQFLPDLRGTAQRPIWIGGTSNSRPVIAGGVEGLHLTRPAYVVITRLELRDQLATGINIDDGVGYANDAHHVALVDLYIHDVYMDINGACVRASGVDDLAIYDSRLHSCAAAITQVGVHRAVIARNRISGALLHGVKLGAGSTDIDIRQNRLDYPGSGAIVMGGETSLAAYRPALSKTSPNADARRVRAFNNYVTGKTNTAFSFKGCVDCLVAHNVVYADAQTLVEISAGNVSQDGYEFELTKNGRMINNSFVFEQPAAHVVVLPVVDGESFTFANNLWYSYTSPSSSAPVGLPVTETGSLIGIGTGYYPTSGGFCAGPEGGAAAPLPEIDGTIEGYCRADGDAPTIGPGAAGLGCIPI